MWDEADAIDDLARLLLVKLDRLCYCVVMNRTGMSCLIVSCHSLTKSLGRREHLLTMMREGDCYVVPYIRIET